MIAEDTGGDFRRILSRADIKKFIELAYIRVRPPAAIAYTDERGQFCVSKYDKADGIPKPFSDQFLSWGPITGTSIFFHMVFMKSTSCN